MLDEIDLLNKGINPLMTWAEDLAEYIVKAVISKGYDFETLFKKFAKGHNYLDEQSFLNSMQEIRVDNRFKLDKIKQFYYYIDDNKNQRVNFREMESIVKNYWNKSSQKLIDEIMDSLKIQIERNKIKIKDIVKTLESYSRNDLIDNKSFRRVLLKDLKLRLEDIDIDFMSEIYKDKRDKRSMKYTNFVKELEK